MAKKVVTHKGNNGMVTTSAVQTFEGPLPAPADFAAYKESLPSAPERIMSMAEDEQDYRHKINNKVVNFGLIESILGMCFALIAVLVCIAAAVFLALKGYVSVSIAIIGVVGTLAAIFYLKKDPTERK